MSSVAVTLLQCTISNNVALVVSSTSVLCMKIMYGSTLFHVYVRGNAVSDGLIKFLSVSLSVDGTQLSRDGWCDLNEGFLAIAEP